MKISFTFIFCALIMTSVSYAQMNVYTPNAEGGPTDIFMKGIILPAIKSITGLEVQNYTASTEIEKIIGEVKLNKNSIVVMTDANVVRYEKLTSTKITEHLNINSVLAITPVVLFKSKRSKIDWNSLINKEVKIGYIEGAASDRCATQMKAEYGTGIQLIKAKSEADIAIQLIESNIDGYCTASLNSINSIMQAGHIIPVAASNKISFSPYNNLNPYFPDNRIITARSFVAVFSSSKSVEGGNLAKKLNEFFARDAKSISDFNKIYLQPVANEK